MDSQTIRELARELQARSDEEYLLARGEGHAHCDVPMVHGLRALLLRELATDLHTRAIKADQARRRDRL